MKIRNIELYPLDALIINRVNADNSTTTMYRTDDGGDIPSELLDKEVSDLYISGKNAFSLTEHRIIEVEYMG